MSAPFRDLPKPPHYRLLRCPQGHGMEEQINALAEHGYEPVMMSAKSDSEVLFVLMVKR